MCLAIPAKVKKVNGAESVVTYGDIELQASLELVEECKAGDWVIVHAGYVIQKLDTDEALARLDILKNVA
jgi:hydrogenase expression/formation protein HypC